MALAGAPLEGLSTFVGPPRPPNFDPTAEVNVEDDACKRGGVTDEGIFTVANIKTAIATATAATSLYNALRMARLRKKIGDAYAKIAEDQRKYYSDKYKPIELANIKEASEWEEPEYDEEKAELNRGQMMISARAPFVGTIEDALRCTGRYCTGQRAAITNDLLTEQMAAEALVAGMAHRYNEAEKQVQEDQRWEYRRNVLNLGRGIPAEASAYAELASGIFGSLGQQAGQAALGAATWLKYQNKRRATVYNEDSRGPLYTPQYIRKLPEVKMPEAAEPKAAFEPEKVNMPTVEVTVVPEEKNLE